MKKPLSTTPNQESVSTARKHKVSVPCIPMVSPLVAHRQAVENSSQKVEKDTASKASVTKGMQTPKYIQNQSNQARESTKKGMNYTLQNEMVTHSKINPCVQEEGQADLPEKGTTPC